MHDGVGSGDDDVPRILVVDDEPQFAALTVDYLERELEDPAVAVELDAEAALDRIDAEPFDAVVSDHRMPGPSGIEFLSTLRESHPDLPFILFTGEGSEDVAGEAISAGVTDYLQKGGTERFELLANRVETAVEKHRTETQLDRSEDRYRTLVELAPVPIVVHQGKEVVYANREAAEFLAGGDREALHGCSPMEFVPPENRASIAERIRTVFETGEPAETIEQELRTLDGERQQALVAGAPISYEGERAVLTVARDVTERRRRERWFRELFRHANDAILVVDGESERIHEANPNAVDVLGDGRDDLVGRTLEELHHGDVDEIRSYFDRVLEEGSGQLDDVACRTVDGRDVRCDLSATAIDYEGTRCVLAVARPVSD